MKAIPLLVISLLVALGGQAWSQEPDVTLRQLNHRVFTANDGAPSDINALAQTPDGTLWIGGRAGLARFDGMQFVAYPGPSEEPLPGTNIASLFASPDGGLWIGFRPGGAAFLKGGHVTRYGVKEGLPDGTLEQFAWDRDGSFWAATRRGLARFTGARWEKHSGTSDIETPYGVLLDRRGTFWVAAINGLFARVAGDAQFREVDRSLTFGPGGSVLAEAPDGRIYAAPQYKLVRVDRPEDPRSGGAVTVRGVTSGPLLFDSGGNLWASDIETKAVLRVSDRTVAAMGPKDLVVSPESFSPGGGVSSGRIFVTLQDREGNVWIGSDNGLHRFSRSNVVRIAAPRCYQYGFTAAAFAAGDNGTLWIACGDYSGSRVDEIRDGALVSSQVTPPFSAAYRDPDGTVWFGGSTAIAHLVNRRIVSEPLPAEVQGRPIAGLVRDRSGAMWVSVTRRSLFRVVDGRWTEYGNLAALPRGWPIVQTRDDNGVLWFGYANNQVARLDGEDVTLFDERQGLDVGNVLSILAQEGEVWVGGELGFARLDGSRFKSVNSTAEEFRGISGIVRARNGDLWLNGIDGILRVGGDEIEGLVRIPTHRAQVEIFNHLDGVPGTAVQLRPQQSAVETSDGRIWFSRTAGMVSIDATQLRRNVLPPPVTIWSLSSGSMRYPNVGKDIRLPIHTTRLQIEYSAGSLSVPERVRFQHKLEGLDRQWQDAGARREALYTNLSPGNYRFRLKASNNDGVWNEAGTSITFSIAPAFYQTRWFYAFCVLGCVAVLVALYRVRVRQVAAQVRGRLEARLSERERIARELHDTLLQGMQGLIWRFQAAADRLPPEEPARQMLEQSLDRADQLLGESRDKVKDLRPTYTNLSDLGQTLAEEGQQFAQLHHAQFRVAVQGASHDLHPIVREELLLIGREALANAFRHSGAKLIEAELTYGDSALHLRIRDDGLGISAAVLNEGGLPGHFGLVGMRERAKKLGGRLEVWSKPGAGTEVDMRVPANVAYRQPQSSTAGSASTLAAARTTAQGR